jgi:hypothetical protein
MCGMSWVCLCLFADVLYGQTDLEDTAQAFIDIARNSSMTGQNIVVGELSFLTA